MNSYESKSSQKIDHEIDSRLQLEHANRCRLLWFLRVRAFSSTQVSPSYQQAKQNLEDEKGRLKGITTRRNSASSNEERRACQKRETALAPFHAQTRPWQLRVSVSSSPENVVTYYCWRWAWARDARPRPAKLYFTQLRFAYLPICHFFHIFENCQWFHNLCAWTHHLAICPLLMSFHNVVFQTQDQCMSFPPYILLEHS